MFKKQKGQSPLGALSGTSSNRVLLAKLFFIAIAMFGFGYALVPFYKVICEVTGINQLVKKQGETSSFIIGREDPSRKIQIQFDNYRSSPLVEITPRQKHLDVNVGGLNTVTYLVKNLTNRRLVGQALPSYSPAFADQYFNKLECFCFRQQTIEPGQVREFPVVFAIAHELPQDVKTITLSYRFFEVTAAQ